MRPRCRPTNTYVSTDATETNTGIATSEIPTDAVTWSFNWMDSRMRWRIQALMPTTKTHIHAMDASCR